MGIALKRLLLLLVSMYLLTGTLAAADLVYKVDIKDEIGPGVWRTVKKSFDDATRQHASCVVIDMNTYGGLVVYADSLRSLILNYPKPVWVFVNKNAMSAGALISIACDKIYMQEGSAIGAATVVNQTGEAMPDKYQSSMRAMMRATAQAHGRDTLIHGRDTVYHWKRNPDIAEAMVDETLVVPGVVDSGKIVTFTPHEAIKYGFCDGIAVNVEDILKQEKLEEYQIMEYHPTLLDKLIGFLMHPIVQSLLIMAIVGGIYFELQTPGVGFPLVLAITACVLYFAPLYLEGLAAYWELVLFILGVLLLGIEVFALPGFGITGIAGVLCVLFALAMAGIDEISFEFWGDFVSMLLWSLFSVVASAVVALVASIWLGGRIFGSRRLAFALHAEQRVEDGYVGVDLNMVQELQKQGVAYTDLRPSGSVDIDGELYDAVSDQGEYIPKNTPVRVVRFQAGQLYVVKG